MYVTFVRLILVCLTHIVFVTFACHVLSMHCLTNIFIVTIGLHVTFYQCRLLHTLCDTIAIADGALRETLLQDDGVGMLNVSCPNPSCGLLLSFPTSACGGDVICGVCQARFPLLGVGSESST